jgi:hypothetical protein
LTFRESAWRLEKNLLQGRPLRAANGQDNGVRLIDLNDDGFLDVVSANEQYGLTRIWNPKEKKWHDTGFPMSLATPDARGIRQETGVKFGIVHPDGRVSAFISKEAFSKAWTFDGKDWIEDKLLLSGLILNGKPIFSSLGDNQTGRRDCGVRFRDVDKDGICELIASNEKQNAIFSWSPKKKTWKKLSYKLPNGVSIANANGEDTGLRFVDVNEDGFVDVIFSNENRWSLHLFVPKSFLGLKTGWTQRIVSGKRGQPGEVPMIVRGGAHPNNGAWFHSRQLWVQNEDTARLPDIVERRSFDELLKSQSK